MPYKKELLLLDLNNNVEIEKMCALLNCTEAVLRLCVVYSGNSIVSIESFLSKNKEWLDKQ